MEEKSGDPGRDLLRMLAATSPADRAVYAVVGLLLFGAVLFPSLLALDPRVAVTLAYDDGKGSPRDPWGSPFLSIVDSEAPPDVTARRLPGSFDLALLESFFLYSSGPNGQDERGRG